MASKIKGFTMNLFNKRGRRKTTSNLSLTSMTLGESKSIAGGMLFRPKPPPLPGTPPKPEKP